MKGANLPSATPGSLMEAVVLSFTTENVFGMGCLWFNRMCDSCPSPITAEKADGCESADNEETQFHET